MLTNHDLLFGAVSAVLTAVLPGWFVAPQLRNRHYARAAMVVLMIFSIAALFSIYVIHPGDIGKAFKYGITTSFFGLIMAAMYAYFPIKRPTS